MHNSLDLPTDSALPVSGVQVEDIANAATDQSIPLDLKNEQATAKSWGFHQRFAYMYTTCATCQAPLDNSEQLSNIENPEVYCTRTKAMDHLPISCMACDGKYRGMKELIDHASYTHFRRDLGLFEFHYSFRCAIQDCSMKVLPHRVNRHFQICHPDLQYRCAQCGIGCGSLKDLDKHGDQTMHAAYICRYPDCGTECTRIAELIRHQLAHRSTVPRYACLHCRKYRGANGFKRKDHLRQHIRNYHHIDDSPRGSNADESAGHACTFDGCDKTGLNAFETEKLLKVHLKKEHPSPYQCSYPGCHRIGTNGWMLERAMVKHMKKDHDV
ncbi:hypothetical protein N431DRAFT_122026 [Stipitochalara longipes BDJ]|nr:hypothetical protein N431DRAFT_122026 [Stipitochalara longipes BDJ]